MQHEHTATASTRPSAGHLTHDERELLDCCVDSVSTLDVLAAMRLHPVRRWSRGELALHTGGNDDLTRSALVSLQERGLIVEDSEGFALAPLEPVAEAAFAHLVTMWSTRRHVVVEHIRRRSAC